MKNSRNITKTSFKKEKKKQQKKSSFKTLMKINFCHQNLIKKYIQFKMEKPLEDLTFHNFHNLILFNPKTEEVSFNVNCQKT